MKKLFIFTLFIFLFLLAGCNDKTVNEDENGLEIIDISIVDAMTSIGAIGDQQRLSYEFTLSNEREITVKKDSLQIVLIDSLEDKKIEDEISEVRFDGDTIIMKGYVLFDSKNFTKIDVIDHEPLIKGIRLETESGKQIIIQYNQQKEEI